ncbi:GNAT family N-acetyltransferase [Afifella pfennigii]|uniref:GNAT family N-acetyltransferase n=1 Tax=Afifella pfennigii TaxID=209897 RepID=UPI0004797D2B|nr:GNAT family protein [Afifella pfennigii]
MTKTDLSGFTPRPLPGGRVLQGRLVRLEPLSWPAHRDGLFAALGGAAHAAIWRHMAIGPFASAEMLRKSFTEAASDDWRTLVIRLLADSDIVGMASYMRNRPEHGSTEVGCIAYAPRLQNSAAGTEAMALMAAHVFDELRYRRYEWKCDDANVASKRAAIRLGFTFEGVFRQDMVVKGRNRDTAWFSMLDGEWPEVKAGYDAWLAPDNFDANDRQRRRLEACRQPLAAQ